jgi:ribosome recycling factor
MEEVTLLLAETEENMEKSISHLSSELNKLRAGKATPQLLDGVMVDYYGALTPIAQVANINTPDAKTIVVQPWEKPLLGSVEKAIIAANLGFNPQNDGSIIRITLPPLTEERRKQLVKMSKGEGENAKVSIRTIRKETNDAIKKLVKDGMPEDLGKTSETKVQEITDRYIKKVEEVLAVKEKEIMTV